MDLNFVYASEASPNAVLSYTSKSPREDTWALSLLLLTASILAIFRSKNKANASISLCEMIRFYSIGDSYFCLLWFCLCVKEALSVLQWPSFSLAITRHALRHVVHRLCMHHVIEVVRHFDCTILVEILVCLNVSHIVMAGKSGNKWHDILRYVFNANHWYCKDTKFKERTFNSW